MRTPDGAFDEMLAEAASATGRHRDAAERALVDAQRNPVMSAGESFLLAQVHALLAIEQRLGQLVDGHARRLLAEDSCAEVGLDNNERSVHGYRRFGASTAHRKAERRS
jgi:hypothetical protein